jgi:hypothetical protein
LSSEVDFAALSALEQLAQLASEGTRRIFIAQHSINLQANAGENCIYVLELPANYRGTAGGRIGGFGERKIQKLYRFNFGKEREAEVYETEDPEKLERLELPYHAASVDLTMPDGTEKIVSGVIDAELVQRYNAEIQPHN